MLNRTRVLQGLRGAVHFERLRVLPPRDGYALWADTYPPWPHNPLMQVEQDVVRPMLELARPTRALDVGTGTGRYVPILASAGARVIVGVDLSLAMLNRNSSDAPRVCCDGCRLPFADASFDLVCASLMVGDVEDLAAWVREGARVLAPTGHLVYSDFHPSAAANRMRRTFRGADGRKWELSYFPHQIDDHLAQLKRTGLMIKAIREPRLPGHSEPVVVAFHAMKPRLRVWPLFQPGRRSAQSVKPETLNNHETRENCGEPA